MIDEERIEFHRIAKDIAKASQDLEALKDRVVKRAFGESHLTVPFYVAGTGLNIALETMAEHERNLDEGKYDPQMK